MPERERCSELRQIFEIVFIILDKLWQAEERKLRAYGTFTPVIFSNEERISAFSAAPLNALPRPARLSASPRASKAASCARAASVTIGSSSQVVTGSMVMPGFGARSCRERSVFAIVMRQSYHAAPKSQQLGCQCLRAATGGFSSAVFRDSAATDGRDGDFLQNIKCD